MAGDTAEHTTGAAAPDEAARIAPSAPLAARAVTPSQQARRQRMLGAALALAARGGFDGVQMRDVAEDAGVALGTLYRYFPSKVHLLAETLGDRLEAVRAQVTDDLPAGEPPERAIAALRRLLAEMERGPAAAEAMIRAVMAADATASAEVERINEISLLFITEAAYGRAHRVDGRDRVAARVIGNVLMTELLGWVSGRSDLAGVVRSLEQTVAIVFAGREAVDLDGDPS